MVVLLVGLMGEGVSNMNKRSGQAVEGSVIVIVVAVGSLYLLGVQVHKGVKHLGCIVSTGHKCAPKPVVVPNKQVQP